MDIPYIAPKDIIGYMLEKHPELLVGGLQNSGERASHIKAFWSAFHLTEPNHMVFQEHPDSLEYVLPLCLHGDEGRGKRRSKTTVVSLETPFGVMTAVNLKKRKHEDCQCNPPENIRRKYHCPDRGRAGMTDRTHTVLDGQATNTKGHSFLQHFPLFVLPGPVTEAFPTLVPALLEEISEQLRVLFFDGITSPRAAGRTFNVACIGHKGDLKWFTIVGCLARSYERQGFVQHIPCCHLCMGGSRGIEWEDFSEDPIWARTILTVTPFVPQNPSPFRRIPGCPLSIENITCYFYLAEHVSMLRKTNIFSCTLQVTQIRSFSGSHVQDRRLPHSKGWVPPRLLWFSHLLSQQPGILWRRQFPIMSSGCPLQFQRLVPPDRAHPCFEKIHQVVF